MRATVAAELFLLSLAGSSMDGFAMDLVASLSRDSIEITEDFKGTDVVVTGVTEAEAGEPAGFETHDVVVVVRSEGLHRVAVYKKERVGPIFMNRDLHHFADVPGFYFVVSSRPLKEIAPSETLEQFELGIKTTGTGPAPGSVDGVREFREAIIRARVRENLFSEREGSVMFLSGSMFRATVAIPANIPAGNLRISIYVFEKSQVVASNTMTLFVDRTGIVRRLSAFARDLPWAYGAVVIVLLGLVGLLSSASFGEEHEQEPDRLIGWGLSGEATATEHDSVATNKD